jgi:hypothetical protein
VGRRKMRKGEEGRKERRNGQRNMRKEGWTERVRKKTNRWRVLENEDPPRVCKF